MSDKNFDFESFKKEAIEKLKAGKGLTGAEGAFTPLLKNILEELLKGEVEEHLRESDQANRKNGKGVKKRISVGEFELETPRDRAGTFLPKVIAKRQKNLPNDLDSTFPFVIRYPHTMSTRSKIIF